MHIVIILFIAAVLGVIGTMYFKGEQEVVAPIEPAPVTEQAPSKENGTTTGAVPAPAAESQTYEDGTYNATGAYSSPAGQESVEVTLVLKDDMVTAATFKGNATHPTSKLNQQKFAAGYEVLVVGKSLDSISLTVVNGSSLTPKGFMDALADIKADAQG